MKYFYSLILHTHKHLLTLGELMCISRKTVKERLVKILNDQSLFPNLTKITITGHSDGSQFTQRYAAGNLLDGAMDMSFKYVIANPGSYMYLNNERLSKGETCLEDGTCTATFTADWDPDLECSDTYNQYKYGLDDRSFGYMAEW